MKICFLSSKHPPFDKRIFDKEAMALHRAGHEISHIAPHAASCADRSGIRIVVYPPPVGIMSRMLQIPRLYLLASKVDADAYHCNEVDSWFVGFLLKVFRGKLLVFDVHEHYPSTFAESRFPNWMRPLVEALVRLIFRMLSPFTDRLVFAKRSVKQDFEGTEYKQVLVQNFTPRCSRVEGKSGGDSQVRKNSGLTAIHLGLISRLRGWPELLDALALMQSDDLRLKVIGTFNDGSRTAFETKAEELGLTNRITVIDWMPFEQAFAELCSADIGLVLFQPGVQNHIYALPHKLFDYMLAELPVVVPAFAEEVASIVEREDCGFTVDPADPSEIAQALDSLVGDDKVRTRFGKQGRRAVLERYNWETEADKLIHMYAALNGTES